MKKVLINKVETVEMEIRPRMMIIHFDRWKADGDKNGVGAVMMKFSSDDGRTMVKKHVPGDPGFRKIFKGLNIKKIMEGYLAQEFSDAAIVDLEERPEQIVQPPEPEEG